MKKVFFIIICGIITILIYQKNDEIIIPSDAIRVRIIANSNSIADLYAKRKLKEEIKTDLYSLTNNALTFFEANNNIQQNIDKIKGLISQKTNNFHISYGNNYFPKKVYRGVIYPAGEYKSLVITLGEGMGDNWWCVLYPPLCLIEDDNSTSDVEYHFLVRDLLKN